MRGVLDLCSLSGRACYRAVVLSFRKRTRLVAVVVLLSLLIAALPVSGTRTSASSNGPTVATVSQESLPRQFYRSVRTTFAAIGTWVAANLRAEPAAAPAVSTYQPVTAYLSPEPPFIDAPTALTVTAAADTSLSLSWTAPAGSVDHYQIERSQSISGPFLFRANTASTTFNDTSVTTDQAYLYRVRAVTSGGTPSVPSNMALGTATSFEFNGTAALQGKTVKKQHFYDIRTAINAVRLVAGLAPASWSPRADLTDQTVMANDVQEMRNKLTEALTVLDVPILAYQDATLLTGASGTVVKAIHIDQLQVRSTRGASTGSGPIDTDSSTARLDPLNQTGGGIDNPLSRNFNWKLSLLGLSGRAGMDLGLSLSYNSLVWTRMGNSISFDDDYGFPSPGFRLGFPVIQQPAYVNTEVGKEAYLLIDSDGSRTELRQVSSTGPGATLYESANSSHLLLDTTTTPFTLRTSNGTQLRYELKGTEYQCTKVTDRNGNYITISYTTTNRIAIDEIVDTLGRHIDFVYDANGWLTQIKQLWNGSTPHYWARFEYTNTTIDTDFGTMTVYGPADTMQIKTLSKVTLPDDSYYDFDYTSWGQVSKITYFGSDDLPINYRSYNLPADDELEHNDCPRFTSRKDWAKYWNGDTNGTMATAEEVVTGFIIPESDSWIMPDETSRDGVRAQVTLPDGTINKIYFVGTAGMSSGWSRGLPMLVDTVSGGDIQRRVATIWTQDNTSVPYPLNPRVLETNVHDLAENRARTKIEYQQFTFSNGTSCWFPRDVIEYDSDAETKIRTARTNYNTNAAYTDRRILGLPSETLLYQGDANATTPILKAKTEYVYDESASFDGTSVPIQHDATNYAAHFVGRANITKVIRHSVTAAESTGTRIKYNRAGAIISTKDAADHEIEISYADSFSDSVNRNTFAYPTTITDPDDYSSTTKYNFDFGAVTYKQTPLPNQAVNLGGPEQTFAYDSLGRLQQITNLVNSAYRRFEYSTASQLRVDTYTTIQETQGEARSFEITDGFGRVIAIASQHPGSAGGYSGQRTVYDAMGRTFKTSNPTETDAAGTPFEWDAMGDDANWLYTEQTYDWKGRPLRTTHPNTTYKEAAYDGCGCAGGQVVTLTDEGTIDGGTEKRRQQKIYSDVLGRTVKTELLNWSGGSVYSATVNTYNVRDQVEQVTQYAGPVGGGTTSQTTTMTYDGYGRLSTRHVPEQSDNTATVWTYNADDTVNTITDARGAATTYTHNGRHLVTGISYSAPSPITVPASVSYTYDAAGNRKSMTDGMGSVNYTLNSLSRVTSETRTFTGLSSFTLSYEYNLAGQLTSITDPFGAEVEYAHNKIGRVTAVTGSTFGSVSTYASSIEYRAWGAVESLTYGNSKTLSVTYDANLQAATYEVPGVMKKGYTYYNDGKLKFTQDQLTTNSKFDRLYRYDHVGRVTKALSGLEAREQGTTNDRPYNETMTYDAFDHLTSREVFQWDRHDMTLDTYTKNRRDFWTYDADGRLLVGSNQFTYDAAGRVIKFGFGDPDETEQQFDGDGRTAKTVVRIFNPETSQWTTDSINYSVRSSVLGGEVVTELDGTGAKERTFVHFRKDVMAIQTTGGGQFVSWQHYDASRASFRPTTTLGIGLGKELDPFGADAGVMKPITWTPPSSPGRIQPFYGVPELNSATQGCELDRVPVPCDMLNALMEAGGVTREELMDSGGSHGLRFYHSDYKSHGLGLYTYYDFFLNEYGEPADERNLHHAQRVFPDFVDPLKVKKCAQDIYGVNGSIGWSPKNNIYRFHGSKKVEGWFSASEEWVSVTPDWSKTWADLSKITRAGLTGGVAGGYTDHKNPSRPYVANDITNPKTQYALFVHELGNALAFLTEKAHVNFMNDLIYDDPSIEPTPEQQQRWGHNDPGVKFEDCVFGSPMSAGSYR